jgi:hypothetical protein
MNSEFEAEKNAVAAERVKAMDKFSSYPEVQWVWKKAKEIEDGLVKKTQDITITAEERSQAAHQLHGFRLFYHIPKEERDVAMRLFKELTQKEKPPAEEQRET